MAKATQSLFIVGLVGAAVCALSACGSTTALDSQLDEQSISSAVALDIARWLESRGPFVYVTVPSDAVGTTAFASAIDQTDPCPLAGTIAFQGQASGTFNRQTAELVESTEFVETLVECGFSVPTTIAVTGEISTTGATHNSAAGVVSTWIRFGSLTVRLGAEGASTTCAYELTSELESSSPEAEAILTIRGSVCSESLDDTRPFGSSASAVTNDGKAGR